jgi:hypothetical protein
VKVALLGHKGVSTVLLITLINHLLYPSDLQSVEKELTTPSPA